MKAKHWLSVSYSVGQIGFGLILHPYQTMQSLVQDRVFVWMTLLPTAILALVTTSWRFVIVPLVKLVFSCQSNNLVVCNFLPFTSNLLTFFCIYWQLMLLYLLLRFSLAFKD